MACFPFHHSTNSRSKCKTGALIKHFLSVCKRPILHWRRGRTNDDAEETHNTVNQLVSHKHDTWGAES